MKIMGYASTIEFIEGKDFDTHDPYGPAIDFLDSLQPGDVAIVATGHSAQSAFWGELFSTAAKGRGANGVVTDGPLRDTQEILPVGFSAFGIGTLPFDYKGRMKVSNAHARVNCGGVEVNQGDFIVADNDGVAVVPASKIDEVITLANERARRESTVLKELLEGKSVRSVWDKHRVL
jgi:regulator of RNase E activity RraA